MLAVVIVLCLVRVSSAYELTCSKSENANVTMLPSDDDVDGRYTTQVCVEMKPNVTKWSLDLMLNNHITCDKQHNKVHIGRTHTYIEDEAIGDRIKSLNCTHVCLTTHIDLVFNGCYIIKSILYTDSKQFAPYDTYINIKNDYTFEHFNKTPELIINNHEKDTSITFFIRVLPDQYMVQLAYLNKSTAAEENVTDNCTSSEGYLRVACSLQLAAGCYKIYLTNYLYHSGVFLSRWRVHKQWCRAPAAGAHAGADWSAAWASGALALALLAAAAVCSHLHRRHLHKRVWKYWTHLSSRPAAGERGAAAGGAAASARVLLLYAREGERGARLVAALRALLQRHAHVQVLDLFDPECVSEAGAAPHAWLQRVLAVHRVVVLQTPALAALYMPRHTDTSTLAPLLASGAVQRAPHYGDSLLQYALRRVADDACHPSAYNKYYIATLSRLRTEVFPCVVPFRRYALPPAAPALARDLCGAGAAPAAPVCTAADDELLALQRAADDFVAHVQDNPDYLMDELLIT